MTTAERLAREANRPLGATETRAYLDAPITEREPDDTHALIVWLTRRYPTGLDRLRYVRQAYGRWRRMADSVAAKE